MLRRLAALRLRTRVALMAAVVSVPVAVGVVVLVVIGGVGYRSCALVGVSGVAGVSVSVPIPGIAAKIEALKRRAVRAGKPLTVAQFERGLRRHMRSSSGIRGVVVCVDGRCRRHPVWGMRDFAAFSGVRAGGPRRVPVVVAIDRPARPVQVASGTVRLTRQEPNGPGCGTWWSGSGRVVGDRVES